MVVLQIIASGIIATAAMTFFMNICAVVSRRNMYTISILRQMLPSLFRTKQPIDTTLSSLSAISLHYGIGILFSIAYHLLRISEGYIGSINATEPLIIGIILGAIAVGGWTIFVRIHPVPLTTVPWQLYMLCIFAGHIIFAFVMIFCYDRFEVIF